MLLIEKLTSVALTDIESKAFDLLKRTVQNDNTYYYLYGNLQSRESTKDEYNVIFDKYNRYVKPLSVDEVNEHVRNIDAKAVLFLNHIEDKNRLAKELLHRDLTSQLPGIDEYVNAENGEEIRNLTRNCTYDSDGLIYITNDFKLLPQGLILNNKGLFYHQFLRRFFTARFVDTPQILEYMQSDDVKLRILLDPLRITEPHRIQNILEADHWYGAKFDVSKMEDPHYIGLNTHIRGVAGRRLLHHVYPIDRTIFYLKNYKNGTKEMQIEEIVPTNSRIGSGQDYVLHRFAHLIWDSETKSFNHIDGSVLAYKKEDHEIRVTYDWKPPQNVDIKGKRIKLFRLDGKLEFEMAINLLYSFFRYNEMIQEYFTSVDFADSDMYRESPLFEKTEEELAELDKMQEEYDRSVKK